MSPEVQATFRTDAPTAESAPLRLPHSDANPITGGRVELQILTTLKCNLKCTYCSLGVGEILGSQTEIRYSIGQLAAFVGKHLHGKEVYVTFYGGEPTLNKGMMEAVMCRFPEFRYQLQTNGTLLDNLPSWMLAKFSNILVSVDGGEKTTDGYRGRGVWRQVIRNLNRINRHVGGTVTARVTWGNPDTTFEELDELVSAVESIDYVYWQFVADEQYSKDSLDKRKAVLIKLIEKFFSRTDKLYPLVPLMGIVRNKLLPARAQELYAGFTQCRVSTHLINVMPSGQIYPCPDMMYEPDMQMGEIQGNWLKKSPLQPTSDMPCEACEAFSWCRRNCMKNLYLGYVEKNDRYRENVVEPICELVKFIGREIDRHDLHNWFSTITLPVRKQITDCEIYEYVEIMP